MPVYCKCCNGVLRSSGRMASAKGRKICKRCSNHRQDPCHNCSMWREREGGGDEDLGDEEGGKNRLQYEGQHSGAPKHFFPQKRHDEYPQVSFAAHVDALNAAQVTAAFLYRGLCPQHIVANFANLQVCSEHDSLALTDSASVSHSFPLCRITWSISGSACAPMLRTLRLPPALPSKLIACASMTMSHLARSRVNAGTSMAMSLWTTRRTPSPPSCSGCDHS